MFYDPMIAKLITWAPTRIEAIDTQVDALDLFVIDGISDNGDFLSALMPHARCRSGDITMGFIAEEYPERIRGYACGRAADRRPCRRRIDDRDGARELCTL